MRRVRAADPSPLEIVDAHIARISGIEPQVNALVTDDFDTATSTGGGAGRARFRDGPGAQPGLMRGGG